MARYANVGVFIAPVVAVGVGVWAEFAELTAPVLFAVSLPAMIVSTVCAAFVWHRAKFTLSVPIAPGKRAPALPEALSMRSARPRYW